MYGTLYLSHEHCEVCEFLGLLGWLELEELKQCHVVPVLKQELILVAIGVPLDVALIREIRLHHCTFNKIELRD